MFKQLYYHNDKAYLVNRRIPTHNFEKKGELNLDFVKAWMGWLGCDHVLRDQTHFIFVETIQDIEFEEINNGEI
jgi:hypothetical protein